MSIQETLYKDPYLYSTPDMFSPPAERLPHVIRFEKTIGCSYGKCTFCNGYPNVPFQSRSLRDYECHVDEVWNQFRFLEHELGETQQLKRVFIGGGDLLADPTGELIAAVRYTEERFYDHTRFSPSRISAYGRTRSILGKSCDDFYDLRQIRVILAS